MERDEHLYLYAMQEIDNSSKDESLWIKAYALVDGNDEKIKSKYIQLRVEQIKDTCRHHGIDFEEVDINHIQKIIHTENDDSWIDSLFYWANEYKILEYGLYAAGGYNSMFGEIDDRGEFSYYGIPRNKNKLMSLEELSIPGPGGNTIISDSLEYIDRPKSLKTIPKEIGNLINLKKLVIKNTSLEVLPSEICHLSNLRELNISAYKCYNNCKAELPSSFKELNKLQYLQVVSYNLIELPKQICTIRSLRKLDLKENLLKELPIEIGLLENLKYLDLSWNNLEKLPKEIINLKNLEYVDISNNPNLLIDDEQKNFLFSIEEKTNSSVKYDPNSIVGQNNIDIKSFSKLISSDLQKTDDIFSLTELDLENKKLESFPLAIVKLGQIVKINLSGNKIVNLPLELEELKNLKEIDLSYNKLRNDSLISLSKVTNLKRLNLHSNNLTELPDVLIHLNSLEEIDLGYNKLTTVSFQVLSKMKNLKKINLENCRLTNIPNSFVMLTDLEEINLSGNELSVHALNLIFNMPNLKKLTLNRQPYKGNDYIFEFSNEMTKLQNLEEFFCETHSSMDSLPLSKSSIKNLSKIKSLKKLSLWKTWVTEKDLVELTKLSNLTHLNIAFTDIEYLPQQIEYLSKLKELHVPNRIKSLSNSIYKLKNLKKIIFCYWRYEGTPYNLKLEEKIFFEEIGCEVIYDGYHELFSQ